MHKIVIFYFTINPVLAQDTLSISIVNPSKAQEKWTFTVSSESPAGDSDGTEEKWTFELFYGGLVYNVPMRLNIKQRGEEVLRIKAKYASESLTNLPLYWLWRFSRWSGNASWELEGIHLKLFLKNKPKEVENFDISHGFNLLNINRSWKYQGYFFRAGGGVVLAHPESTIREKRLDEHEGIFNTGYYISGPSINLGISKHFYFSKKFFLSAEIKTSVSYANVPINDGNADVYNTAIHVILGLGYTFIDKEK
ncbi:MAG: hypothetical protein FVQ77_16215 [Cytophagales bacterium]|nr:hypothetical protein [Cytophagales bacterium]